MPELFETERQGRVLVLRIDHPPHNFMNAEMVRQLAGLVRSLRGDRSVGAVVITGKPDALFITHYDVGEILASVRRAGIAAGPRLTAVILRLVGALRRVPGLRGLAGRTPLGSVLELYRIHDLFVAMNRSDKVFIAAINGPATGGGCEISLACDVRYMADAEIAIGLPEMTIDFNPGAGGTQRLPRAVGQGRALEMLLEGRTLSPHEALDFGLVSAVVPHERVKEEAIRTAQRLARRSPEAIRSLKRAVYEGGSMPLARGLAAERKWFMVSSATDSSQRKMAAMTEQVELEGKSPWATADGRRPWQEGTAADGSPSPAEDREA
jgi:enoyl-CoA hydratase